MYLGFFGVALFLGIFLYPLRKHWPWLATIGSTRHWLDIHVLMGLTAPFIVAFHSTLKFKGIAGMAFWIMFAVSASGVVGRYLYAQIPRKMTTAELSMQELRDLQTQLTQQLAAQNLLPEADLRALLRMPDAKRVGAASDRSGVALHGCPRYDPRVPRRPASPPRHTRKRLRADARWFPSDPASRIGEGDSGGFGRSRAVQESAVPLRSQKVFHLWHVVHKPFSYAFAVLALLHIGLQFAMGYF